MPAKYESLTKLIENENEANQYFNGLPEYVKEQIRSRGNSVNSFASLQDYAENLLRGDN